MFSYQVGIEPSYYPRALLRGISLGVQENFNGTKGEGGSELRGREGVQGVQEEMQEMEKTHIRRTNQSREIRAKLNPLLTQLDLKYYDTREIHCSHGKTIMIPLIKVSIPHAMDFHSLICPDLCLCCKIPEPTDREPTHHWYWNTMHTIDQNWNGIEHTVENKKLHNTKRYRRYGLTKTLLTR